MVSSVVASGVQSLGTNFSGSGALQDANRNHLSYNKFGTSYMKAAMIAAGGFSGGISSTIAGGKFIDGFKQGLITAGLNHVAHLGTNFIGSLKKSIVELFIWDKEAAGVDVGHTAIRINGEVYGYYPTDEGGDGGYGWGDVAKSKGEMHIDSESDFYAKYHGDKITSYQVKMTDRQVSSLKNYLLNIAQHPGTYSLAGLNCTSVAIQALTKNGIDIIKSTSVSRFDGDRTIHKLSNGFGVSPNALKLILDNGLNSSYFYNRVYYKIQ